MKKFAYMALVLSVFSLKLAVAADAQVENELVPAASLEEMRDAEMNSNAAETNFETDLAPHWGAVCFAKNLRGQRFEARGYDARDAQWHAMQECRRVSERCFELGCHRD